MNRRVRAALAQLEGLLLVSFYVLSGLPAIASPNHAPVANNDSYTINENTTLHVSAPGVLGNDTDADLDPLTAIKVSNPTHGTLTFNSDGSFTYVPNANFVGSDSFAYEANDGRTVSGVATVTITVLLVNTPPVVANRSFVLAANSNVSIGVSGTDVNGDALTFRVTLLPSHGTVTQVNANTFRYTPNANFVGTDSFLYVANDGHVDSAPGTVTLTVKPTVTINDISQNEGCCSFPAFLTTSMTFTVRLSPAVNHTVTVTSSTRDGTAVAFRDYDPTSATMVFPAGETSSDNLNDFPFVVILGNLVCEPNKEFFVDLHSTDAIVLRSGRGIIVNDDICFGTVEANPTEAVVPAGEPFPISVTWTHPEQWRLLQSIDLLIADNQGAVCYVRWDESSNTFQALDSDGNPVGPAVIPGSRGRLETSAVTLYAQESSVVGSGPEGHTVSLNFNLGFKPLAAGRTFRVEVFATDDFGHQQGFEQVSELTVLDNSH